MKALTVIFCFNEGGKLRQVLDAIPAERSYDVVIIDDGSSDESPAIMSSYGFPILRHNTNRGVGESMKTAFKYASEHNYDAIVMMAGNGKMNPAHITRLLHPILKGGFDYVQGSRYLDGGGSSNMPLYRTVLIKVFTWIVNLFMSVRGTDVTCGFRAYRMDIFERADVNVEQEWLGKYEMEYYIHYKVLRAGLRFTEVAVTMTYPPEKKDYSKIRVGSGWWSMVRPWIFLVLRIKK